MKRYFSLFFLLITIQLASSQQSELTESSLTMLFDSLLIQAESADNQQIIKQITVLEKQGLERFPLWHVRFLQVKSDLLIGLAKADSAFLTAKAAGKIADQYHLTESSQVNNHLIGNLLLKQKKYAESLPYLTNAEQYFRSLDQPIHLSSCLSKKAYGLAVLSRNEEAKVMAAEAFQIIEKTEEVMVKVQIYNDVANTYNLLNDRLNATRMHLKAYDLAKEHGFQKLLAGLGNNLAISFMELRQYEKAKYYSKEAIAICEKSSLDYVKYHLLLGLANISLELHEYDSVEYYLNSLALEDSYKESELLKEEVEIFYAEIAFEQGDYEQAYQHLIKAKKAAKQTEDELSLLTAKAGIARYFEFKQEYESALNLLDTVLNTSIVHLFDLKKPLELQVKIYKTLGNYEQALATQEKIAIIQDSTSVLERIGIIASLEVDYKLKNREEKIERLELENDLVQQKNLQNKRATSGLAIMLLLAIGLGYYFSRHRKLKLEQSLAEVKESLLRLQINPHFIFNTLNSIQSSFLQEDEEKTIHLFSRFSNLMRQVLHNSESAFVPLSEELDLLINYLELEKIRSNDKFDYKIEIEDQVNLYHTQVPSMILQIFVENSIWHGIGPKQGRGLIRIKVEEENGKSKITIEDDGVGRSFSILHKSKDQKSKKSLGTKLAMQRVQQLNRKFGKGLALEVEDRVEKSGTRVSMLA
ncbi:MAG: histidine kinase [Bacteroidota bacterium]